METWVVFTLLAVCMQSIRTAGQKQIAKRISIQATTLIRFLFGLPFVIAYYFLVKNYYGVDDIALEMGFFRPASLAAVAQILATALLVKALTIQNFAVGTALAKTEAIMTALIGSLFFSTALSLLGYVSVFLGVAGVLIASNWQVTVKDILHNKSIKYGLGAGLGFALASLWLRDASLSLATPRLLSAATVLLYMVSLQTILCLIWVAVQDVKQLFGLKSELAACFFIGFTGVAGSVGWFTAMSLQNAAIVKTLGQTEFIVTVLITYLYFNEKVSSKEALGIALVAISVLLLLYVPEV